MKKQILQKHPVSQNRLRIDQELKMQNELIALYSLLSETHITTFSNL